MERSIFAPKNFFQCYKNMFSTGLKNFILILIIILIFHVLIKKALLSRREGFVCAATGATAEKTGADGPLAAAPVEEKTASAPKSTKDIYDMWFGEAGGGAAASSLDGFFKEDLDMSKEAAEAAKCKLSGEVPLGGEMAMPVSTTCDPVFDKNIGEATAKNIKANCNLPQDKRGMMVLTEYENENPMSGGKLFLNLDAYDRDDMAYAPL